MIAKLILDHVVDQLGEAHDQCLLTLRCVRTRQPYEAVARRKQTASIMVRCPITVEMFATEAFPTVLKNEEARACRWFVVEVLVGLDLR